MANYHYMDGLLRTLRHAGRCLVNMIPHYYNKERTVRILGEDDSAEHVTINQPTMEQKEVNGQIVAVDDPKLFSMVGIAVLVVISMLVIWRPLSFASLDPEVAIARGVPVKALGIGFVMLLGLAVAAAVQVVGALLVLALLVTPAAAALRLSSSQLWVPILSVGFAAVSMIGGILLALGSTLPISPYVTTISVLIYLIARAVAAVRSKLAVSK
jgi:zinc/manganese transport system permease protein